MAKTASILGKGKQTGRKKGVLYPMNDIGTERSRAKKRATDIQSVKNQKKSKMFKETDPLALYFKQISKYPLLTVQEEQLIGEKIVVLRQQIGELALEYKDREGDGEYEKKTFLSGEFPALIQEPDDQLQSAFGSFHCQKLPAPGFVPA
jgi:RNA polymerase primary sigma factor